MNLDEIFNEFVDGDTDGEIVRGNMGPAIRDSDYAVLWQNALKHFDKTFYGNKFGHICDVCDRLWFKKERLQHKILQ
jgi:hypothetical protein